MCGSSSFRLISINWSYSAPASATRFSLWCYFCCYFACIDTQEQERGGQTRSVRRVCQSEPHALHARTNTTQTKNMQLPTATRGTLGSLFRHTPRSRLWHTYCLDKTPYMPEPRQPVVSVKIGPASRTPCIVALLSPPLPSLKHTPTHTQRHMLDKAPSVTTASVQQRLGSRRQACSTAAVVTDSHCQPAP